MVFNEIESLLLQVQNDKSASFQGMYFRAWYTVSLHCLRQSDNFSLQNLSWYYATSQARPGEWCWNWFFLIQYDFCLLKISCSWLFVFFFSISILLNCILVQSIFSCILSAMVTWSTIFIPFSGQWGILFILSTPE